jgi:hypothetical protein
MGKLAFLRELITRKLKVRTFAARDLSHLIFGQQHYGTQSFFSERLGQCHTIPLAQMPHFQFLQQGLDQPRENNIYAEYLRCSWSYLYNNRKTSEQVLRRVERFVDQYHQAERAGGTSDDLFSLPVLVCPRPDGKWIIVDGNHRAAIAFKLGCSLKVSVITPARHLLNTSLVPDEFYGSKRLSMPYQSLFEGENELVRGRRPDVYERACKIERADLEGKSVIEYGCNIGGNCFAAAKFGARSLLGVDYSANIITAAIRLNAYFATPTSFQVHDLNHPVNGLEPADTVLCFSVINHLQNKEVLADTLLKTTKNVLYFEGHSKTGLNDYAYLLNHTNFSSITHIGDMRDGIHNDKRRRPLFRCVLRRAT